MNPARWGEYANFTKAEFDCKHTGQNEMKHEFMVVLQRIRSAYGKPMRITSGYRHPSHPIEARKGRTTGEHTMGTCADIACIDGRSRFELINLALQHGITRIGVAKSFLHLGIGGGRLPDKVIWDYQ